MSADPDVLLIAASETDSNLYYAPRFLAPDPFIFLRVKGETILIMSDLEVDRARATATVDTVLPYSDYEGRWKRRETAPPTAVDVVGLVLKARGVKKGHAGLAGACACNDKKRLILKCNCLKLFLI